jgi:hypothetical protein
MNEKEKQELFERVEAQESKQYIHTPYEQVSGHIADFEVIYEILIDSKYEGLKSGQGMRCDFLYDGEDPRKDGIHMIWPELLDGKGYVITDKHVIPENKGKATMWIISNDSRVKYHQKKIKVGTKGYWVVGSTKLAKIEVTKILGLFTNTE